jgi:hypothetical protein
MPRSAPLPDAAKVYAVIPIAVFMIIDAGTASSSPFQRTPKYVHDHAGIVFTFRWNMRSRCAGNRDHERPEYAVAENKGTFRKDSHRVAAACEHLQDTARYAEAFFKRLVPIRVDAERNRLAHVARLRQFRLEQLDGILLVKKLRLEIQSR